MFSKVIWLVFCLVIVTAFSFAALSAKNAG